jgi:hypothetical protein
MSMSNSHLKCALMGGLIVFLWGLFSWMVFPWHQMCFNRFSYETELGNMIQAHAPESGMYVLPNTFYSGKACPEDMQNTMRMVDHGPFVFAAVSKDGMGKMSIGNFLLSLILQIIGAFIATWMLIRTKGVSFFTQIGFFTLFGLSIGVLGLFPFWNWWGFSLCYVLIATLDLVIGWTLAGFAIVKILKHR